jgi:hypothetical protein
MFHDNRSRYILQNEEVNEVILAEVVLHDRLVNQNNVLRRHLLAALHFLNKK